MIGRPWWRNHIGAMSAVAAVALTGCSAGQPNDATQVVAAVARAQIVGNRPVCIDRATHGEPLAVFRTMLPAPDPARRPLAWHPSGPLRQGQKIPTRALVADELRDAHIVLAEPDQDGEPLPAPTQLQLNAYAVQLSKLEADKTVRVPAESQLRPRWWLVNRLDPNCRVPVTVSDPVLARDMAFVSVTAGHFGTLYAVQRSPSGWTPIAKWSDWLY